MVNIIAIDPSFTSTGISILYDDELSFYNIKSHIGEKTFSNIYSCALSIIDELSLIIGDRRFDISINETPPPLARFSAGLFLLDGLLVNYLKSVCETSYVLHPTYLRAVHGKKYTKHDSVVLAKSLLLELGFKLPKKFSHDEAESFLFLCRILKQQGLSDTCLDRFIEKETLI